MFCAVASAPNAADMDGGRRPGNSTDFINLVKLAQSLNAIHAIPEAGTILVKTSVDLSDSIRIVVSDTGKGIDEEEIGKIFQPFFTTKPKGTGLGLSICKRLIEQQNGTIHVARNPEGGLTFTIELPVEQQSGVNLQ